jgi:hypothetical protein
LSETEPSSFVAETSADKLIAVLQRIEKKLDAPPALPPELTLLTAQQIMDVFQIKPTKFYELQLPKYVHGGVIRYRVCDLPDHITAHMQTHDGHPLFKRAMRKREDRAA